MAKTRDQMVVDHAGGLHERIDDGGSHEFEFAGAPSSLEIPIETGVEAGTLAVVLNALIFGLPSTKSHRNFEKPGPSSMSFR